MRSKLSATLFTLLPVSLLACGGGGGGGGGGVDAGQITPAGTHTHYVVNKVSVPTTNDEATEFGLDLGSAHSNQLDKNVDNALGHVLAALTGQGFDVKTSLDAAVAEGSITLLADLQTTDFTNAPAAGLQVLLGDNPTPAPCGSDVGSDGAYNGSNPTVDCGKQFTGGMFDVSASSPTDALVAGPFVNGTFNGGPGNIELQIALGGTTPVSLSLHNARVKATEVTATAMGPTNIGGAILKTDIDTMVIPAIAAQLTPLIARDCGSGGTPPGCGCTSGSTGATLINLFDGDLAGSGSAADPKDCMVSVAEIEGNSLIKALLGPDICVEASCAAPDALSLGVQVTATAATFTVAGE